MTAGDILDEAVRLYRKNAARFILLSVAARVPFSSLALFWLLSAEDYTRYPIRILSWGIETACINQLLIAVVACVVAALLNGQTVSLWQAYGRCLRRSVWLLFAQLSLVVVGFVEGLGLFLTFYLLGTVMDLIRPLNEPYESLLSLFLAASCLIIFCVIPGLWLLARWSLTVPVIMLEGHGTRSAWRRSASLMQGHYRRVMVVMGAVLLWVWLVSSGPSYVAQIITDIMVPFEWQRGALSLWLEVGVVELINTLLLPIPFIAYTLVYYDLRVRNEGYDLLRILEKNG
jgi:cellulose synthase/poly-beta-1,6-N-acetylglucosamine synthase-like glycosyltransferase